MESYPSRSFLFWKAFGVVIFILSILIVIGMLGTYFFCSLSQSNKVRTERPTLIIKEADNDGLREGSPFDDIFNRLKTFVSSSERKRRSLSATVLLSNIDHSPGGTLQAEQSRLDPVEVDSDLLLENLRIKRRAFMERDHLNKMYSHRCKKSPKGDNGECDEIYARILELTKEINENLASLTKLIESDKLHSVYDPTSHSSEEDSDKKKDENGSKKNGTRKDTKGKFEFATENGNSDFSGPKMGVTEPNFNENYSKQKIPLTTVEKIIVTTERGDGKISKVTTNYENSSKQHESKAIKLTTSLFEETTTNDLPKDYNKSDTGNQDFHRKSEKITTQNLSTRTTPLSPDQSSKTIKLIATETSVDLEMTTVSIAVQESTSQSTTDKRHVLPKVDDNPSNTNHSKEKPEIVTHATLAEKSETPLFDLVTKLTIENKDSQVTTKPEMANHTELIPNSAENEIDGPVEWQRGDNQEIPIFPKVHEDLQPRYSMLGENNEFSVDKSSSLFPKNDPILDNSELIDNLEPHFRQSGGQINPNSFVNNFRTDQSNFGANAPFLSFCEQFLKQNNPVTAPPPPNEYPSTIHQKQFTGHGPTAISGGESTKASAQVSFNPFYGMAPYPGCYYGPPAFNYRGYQHPMWWQPMQYPSSYHPSMFAVQSPDYNPLNPKRCLNESRNSDAIIFRPSSEEYEIYDLDARTRGGPATHQGPFGNLNNPGNFGFSGLGTTGPGFISHVTQQSTQTIPGMNSQPVYCTYMMPPHGMPFGGVQNGAFRANEAATQTTNVPEQADIVYASYSNTLNLFNTTNRANKECRDGEIACSSTLQCIPREKWCNNAVDCLDSSDESTCTCKARLKSLKVCDGYPDCPNGEDELGCFGCEKFQFSCYNSVDEYIDSGRMKIAMCYTATDRCDGFRNCINGNDEKDCSTILSEMGQEMHSYVVSHAEGVLHRNHQGRLYPVCEHPSKWAKEACESEFGPLTEEPEIVYRDGSIPGPFIQPASEQEFGLKDPLFSPNCPKLHSGLPRHTFVYVKCPTIKCGLVKEKESYQLMLSNKKFNKSSEAGEEIKRTKRSDVRIVGGVVSAPGSWPFIAAIYKDGGFHCGAIIFNEQWAITAAHCVVGYAFHYYELRVGMLRRYSYSPMMQTLRISHIVEHQGYSHRNMKNDLALLRTHKPMLFNRWVRPICLPAKGRSTNDDDWQRGPDAGTLCTAVGWGAIRESGPTPDNLREVTVPILENCKHKTDKVADDICAGLEEGGQDACQGDSGGPLFCRSVSNSKEWYLAGIVSHGQGCARPDEPGAYTRVSLYLDWIEKSTLTSNMPKILPERHCPGFKCFWGGEKCIPKSQRCDNVVNCLGGEDEVGCLFMHEPILREMQNKTIKKQLESSTMAYEDEKDPKTTMTQPEYEKDTKSMLTTSAATITRGDYSKQLQSTPQFDEFDKASQILDTEEPNQNRSAKDNGGLQTLLSSKPTEGTLPVDEMKTTPVSQSEKTYSSTETPKSTDASVTSSDYLTLPTLADDLAMKIDAKVRHHILKGKTMSMQTSPRPMHTSPRPIQTSPDATGTSFDRLTFPTHASDLALKIDDKVRHHIFKDETMPMQTSSAPIQTSSVPIQTSPDATGTSSDHLTFPTHASDLALNIDDKVRHHIFKDKTTPMQTSSAPIQTSPKPIQPTSDATGTSFDHLTFPTHASDLALKIDDKVRHHILKDETMPMQTSSAPIQTSSVPIQTSPDATGTSSDHLTFPTHASDLALKIDNKDAPRTIKIKPSHHVTKISHHMSKHKTTPMPTPTKASPLFTPHSSTTKPAHFSTLGVVTEPTSFFLFTKKPNAKYSEQSEPPSTATEPYYHATTEKIDLPEELLPPRKKFLCKHIPQSVDLSHRCDLKIDCEDGTDEIGCTCKDFLKENSFENWICDGKVDCEDFTDEAYCGKCQSNEFYCPHSKLCIPAAHRCDEEVDCPQREDELDCVALTDGKKVYVDSTLRPSLQSAGIFTKNFNGTWKIVCDDEIDFSKLGAETAGQVCTLLGFSGYEFYKMTSVGSASSQLPLYGRKDRMAKDIFRVPTKHLLSHYEYGFTSEMQQIPEQTVSSHIIINPTDTFGSENIHGGGGGDDDEECHALYVECVPQFKIGFRPKPPQTHSHSAQTTTIKPILQPIVQPGQTPHVVVPPQKHSNGTISNNSSSNDKLHWTWLVELIVNGQWQCSAVLLDKFWVLASAACIEHINPEVDYLSVLMGESFFDLKMKKFNKQIRRVDCIRQIDSTALVLLHLEYPVHFSRFVLPTFLPEKTKKYLNTNENYQLDCVLVSWHGNSSVEYNPIRLVDSVAAKCNKTGRDEHLCFGLLNRHADDRKCKKINEKNTEIGIVACSENNTSWHPVSLYSQQHQRNCGNVYQDYPEISQFFGKIQDYLDHSECQQIYSAPVCTTLRCPLGKCLSPDNICDGKIHCHDASDENTKLCHVRMDGCLQSELKCRNGLCVPKTKFCDHYNDCGDLTDEPNECSCITYLRVTEPYKICDGIRNCLDKTDESPLVCNCTELTFQCGSSNQCVPRDFVCDNVKDCPKGEDELYCYGVEVPSSPAYTNADSTNITSVPDNDGYGQVIKQSYGVWHTLCVPRGTQPSAAALSEICNNLGYKTSNHSQYRLVDSSTADTSRTIDDNNQPNNDSKYRQPTKAIVVNKFSLLLLNRATKLYIKPSRPIAESAPWNNDDYKNCLRIEIKCSI